MPTSLHEPKERSSKTGKVWEIADELTRRQGYPARRQQVIDAYCVDGGNPNTASTQYALWKKSREQSRQAPECEPGSVPQMQLSIGADGRVLIPAEMRAAMALGAEGKVTVTVENGRLTMISPKAAVREAQRIARSLKKPGESVVDEFLAERRTLWGEE